MVCRLKYIILAIFFFGVIASSILSYRKYNAFVNEIGSITYLISTGLYLYVENNFIEPKDIDDIIDFIKNSSLNNQFEFETKILELKADNIFITVDSLVKVRLRVGGCDANYSNLSITEYSFFDYIVNKDLRLVFRANATKSTTYPFMLILGIKENGNTERIMESSLIRDLGSIISEFDYKSYTIGTHQMKGIVFILNDFDVYNDSLKVTYCNHVGFKKEFIKDIEGIVNKNFLSRKFETIKFGFHLDSLEMSKLMEKIQ